MEGKRAMRGTTDMKRYTKGVGAREFSLVHEFAKIYSKLINYLDILEL